MLFGLLVVLPITIVIWLLVKVVRPKTRISFERLHEGIGIAILMTIVLCFIGAIIGTAAYGIFWQHPWTLLILVAFWIVAGLASLIGHLTTKARQRQRQGQSST